MAKEKNQEVLTSTGNVNKVSSSRWNSFMDRDFSELINSLSAECNNLSRFRVSVVLDLMAVNMLWEMKNDGDLKFSEWLAAQNPEINSIFWGVRKSVELLLRYLNQTKLDPKAKNFIMRDIFLNEELYETIVKYFLDIGEKMLCTIAEAVDPEFALQILTNYINNKPLIDVKSMQYFVKTYNYKNYPKIKNYIDFEHVRKEAAEHLREQKYGKEKKQPSINKTFLSKGVNASTDTLYDLVSTYGTQVSYKEGGLRLSNDIVAGFNINKDLKPELKDYVEKLVFALDEVLENYFLNLTK